jgi:hypothetical protein
LTDCSGGGPGKGKGKGRGATRSIPNYQIVPISQALHEKERERETTSKITIGERKAPNRNTLA